MTPINLIFFFIFGLIIGSFINVVVLRYNTGFSFMKGRSKCFSCGKILSSLELIPVFSYLFIKGRCTSCKSKISIQYPLVELITGLIFLITFWKIGLTLFLPLYLIIFSVLISISLYDFKHKIIPDGMMVAFNLLTLFAWFLTHSFQGQFLIPSLLDLFSGFILFSFFAFLWLVSGGKWMGFGDAKISLGVGWLLGLSGGIFAIMLAFWIGAIWGIFVILLKKLNVFRSSITIKSEIPFAPFIILGLFIQFFLEWNLASLMKILAQ